MLHKASVLPRNPDHGCYCGGVVNWRVAAVHYVAKLVGLLVKIEGMPVGSNRNLEKPHRNQNTGFGINTAG